MNRKILIVDDESSIRELFESAFTEAGYEVLLAENGEAALELFTSQDIHLVFLDLKLFGMNGIDLCREMRKKRPVAIIYAITGWLGLFEIDECREAGFDDYFKKPVSPDLLLHAVEEAFEKLERWYKHYPVP
ncbi:MAG: response regulator [Syntrophaceae bacterium]|nr:response regulator [Syntrophaceae bacterium]